MGTAIALGFLMGVVLVVLHRLLRYDGEKN